MHEPLRRHLPRVPRARVGRSGPGRLDPCSHRGRPPGKPAEPIQAMIPPETLPAPRPSKTPVLPPESSRRRRRSRPPRRRPAVRRAVSRRNEMRLAPHGNRTLIEGTHTRHDPQPRHPVGVTGRFRRGAVRPASCWAYIATTNGRRTAKSTSSPASREFGGTNDLGYRTGGETRLNAGIRFHASPRLTVSIQATGAAGSTSPIASARCRSHPGPGS